MRNKALILIILSILIFNINMIKTKENIIYHNKIIAKIKDSHKIDKEYYGYIEIPKYNIRRLIKNGTENNILDKYYVGKFNINKNNLIVLAGHNVNIVFHKIHYLKENDLIYINNNKYIVYDYKEININDYSYINKIYDKKTIMLITCTKDKNKRYIVLAQLIE